MNNLEKIIIGTMMFSSTFIPSPSLESIASNSNKNTNQQVAYNPEKVNTNKFTIRAGKIEPYFGNEIIFKNGRRLALGVFTDNFYDDNIIVTDITNKNNTVSYIINIKQSDTGEYVEFFGKTYNIGVDFSKGKDINIKISVHLKEEMYFLSLNQMYINRFFDFQENKVSGLDYYILYQPALTVQKYGLFSSKSDKEIRESFTFWSKLYVDKQRELIQSLWNNVSADAQTQLERAVLENSKEPSLDSLSNVLKLKTQLFLDKFASFDELNVRKTLRPAAVVLLGPEKPGATSDPFTLGEKIYHCVYNPESPYIIKWELEELK